MRSGRGPAYGRGVAADAQPGRSQPLRVSIELTPGSAPITGHLADEAGNVVAFTGWLGLMTELDAALGYVSGPGRGDPDIAKGNG